MKTLNAHFDGRNIVLDEPARLELNAKVRVLVPENGESEDADSSHLTTEQFLKGYAPGDAIYDKE